LIEFDLDLEPRHILVYPTVHISNLLFHVNIVRLLFNPCAEKHAKKKIMSTHPKIHFNSKCWYLYVALAFLLMFYRQQRFLLSRKQKCTNSDIKNVQLNVGYLVSQRISFIGMGVKKIYCSWNFPAVIFVLNLPCMTKETQLLSSVYNFVMMPCVRWSNIMRYFILLIYCISVGCRTSYLVGSFICSLFVCFGLWYVIRPIKIFPEWTAGLSNFSTVQIVAERLWIWRWHCKERVTTTLFDFLW
jgi:hypothetical protein